MLSLLKQYSRNCPQTLEALLKRGYDVDIECEFRSEADTQHHRLFTCPGGA